MWDVACQCTVSEILGSSNAYTAGRGGDWLQMRALLHMKCADIVTCCLTATNKLGASAAGNALWLFVSLCECVLIPLCGSDACTCNDFNAPDAKVKAKKKLPSDAAAVPSSPAELAVSDKYIQAQTLCPHCCLKKITSGISHICTSVSSVTRPATIPIPNGDEDVLRDDDDYLSVSYVALHIHMTLDTSHATRHTSHVTRHTSHKNLPTGPRLVVSGWYKP